MYEPLKKTYSIMIKGKEYTYEQASYYNCLEFSYKLSNNTFKFEEWVKEFLGISSLRGVNVELLFQTIIDTAFKGFFAKTKGGGKSVPIESYYMFLAKEFSLDPDTLLRRYTPEQLQYYTEGIIYNLNEQTPEGRRRNKTRQGMKEVKLSDREKDLSEIKAMEDKLNKKKNGI